MAIRIIIESNNPSNEQLHVAVEYLIRGGIVIYPTDTTYAIGANALDEKSIMRVYELKNRPLNKPLHVIVSNIVMAEKYVKFNKNAKILANKCLPGKLTIILPKKKNVPDLLTAGLQTLGFRIPDNITCQMLSTKTNIPITTTSANLSGENPIYSIDELLESLPKEKLDLIDVILDQGVLENTLPSTIVEMTQGKVVLLREGSLPKEMIFNLNQ